MRIRTKVGIVSLLVGAVIAAPLSTAAAQDRDDGRRGGGGLKIVGLVEGTTLVDFRSNSTRLSGSRAVTGLTGGDVRLVGIDYRVQDGRLYGVGNAGGVYTVDDRGRATLALRLTIPLQGTNFGVDFNPAANALRVISDSGQNLRQPFATAGAPTVMDGNLSYTAGSAATGVTGAAYTNNDTDPNTATTLYDLDATTDQIAIQSPANAGTLAATGKLTVDAGPQAGFDIYSTVRGATTTDVTGFATIAVGDRYGLYRITLFTGAAVRVGGFDRAVSDLAIPLGQR